jgi:hypothetical protein
MSADRRSYQREYMRAWKRNRRAKYMEGKVCVWCGSDENLENHHVDPEEKEGHNIWTWSEKRIERELAKCIVLCRHCHRSYHWELRRGEINNQSMILRNLDMAYGGMKR